MRCIGMARQTLPSVLPIVQSSPYRMAFAKDMPDEYVPD
jgi:hypothetical protein